MLTLHPNLCYIQKRRFIEQRSNNVILCVYMFIGCADIDGQFVELGTERTVDCITKKCVSDRGFSILQVVSAGKDRYQLPVIYLYYMPNMTIVEFANSVDENEAAHDEPPHFHPHGLPSFFKQSV